MVDWNGLFAWSTKYHDGTAPTRPDLAAISEEDQKWLEQAMHDYTFDDASRLKDIHDELRADVDANFTTICGPVSDSTDWSKLLDKLDECQELVEQHERSNLNLALLGGLDTLLQYILKHPSPEVREMACLTFSGVVQNHAQVQQVALKSGALNMMLKFVDETTQKNKEAVMGALSSFLRADNFNSKREFIGKMAGLQFLTQCIQETSYSPRLLKKCLVLMHDLVLNDENIFSDKPATVRETLGDQADVVERLIEILMAAGQELTNGQLWDTRLYTLMILFRIFQVRQPLVEKHKQALTAHKLTLAKHLQVCEVDHQELVMKEMKAVDNCLNAATMPIIANYSSEDIANLDKKVMSLGKGQKEEKILSIGGPVAKPAPQGVEEEKKEEL